MMDASKIVSAMKYAHAPIVMRALELRLSLWHRIGRQSLPILLTELTPSEMPPRPVPLEEVTWSLRTAESLCRRLRVVPDTCLYRALTRYAILRQSGYAAKFVMGMNPKAREDLTAHAWVELDGQPYQETLDATMVVNYVYPDGPN